MVKYGRKSEQYIKGVIMLPKNNKEIHQYLSLILPDARAPYIFIYLNYNA
jgi:hypothetical protein